jgi:two-component system nitrate/nitrite response regulator NarL
MPSLGLSPGPPGCVTIPLSLHAAIAVSGLPARVNAGQGKEGSVAPDVTDLHILIIADDPLARTGLSTLLADQPGFAIAGQLAVQPDLADTVGVYQPDVIVWDLGWDPATSLEQMTDLGEPAVPIVALVAGEEQFGEVWAAGVRAILLRETAAERLAAALQAVTQGLAVLDPALSETLRPEKGVPSAELLEELTPRELEVVQLLAQGLSNKAIAYRLEISEHTVKFHVNSIMTKLGAQSRTEAAVRATRLGLVVL